MMTRLTLAAALAALPVPLLAHEAGGIVHAHPHGGEALVVLLTAVAALAIWIARRRS